jgi:hypothetical protein
MAIKNSSLKILGGLVSLCGFLILSTRPMFADMNVGAVQYQYIKELGEIVISCDGIVVERTDHSEAVIPDLAKKDIFLLSCLGQPQTYKRHQKVGEHLIDTEISLVPPTGHGYRGACTTASLVLSVDGTKRVDCTLDNQNLTVRNVTLDINDDFLEVEGAFNGKRSCVTQCRIDKKELIGDKALMDSAER